MKNLIPFSFLLLSQIFFAQPVSIQWQKSLGGTGTEYSNSVQLTNDGGYIVAGSSGSNDGDVTGNHGSDDVWIVKLNASGSIHWQKSLGGTAKESGNSIRQTADGGYIVAGNSASNDGDVTGNHGGDDIWVVKLNSSGIIQWQKSLGESNGDYGNSILQTIDGGYIVTGISLSNDGDVSGNHGAYDIWIVKLSSSGSIQWQKSLGSSAWDFPSPILQTADGGYILAGNSASNDGDVSGNHGASDFWIVKLTSSGSIQWQKSLGGSGGEGANSILQTSDGGYIVAGQSQSNDGDVSGNHGGLDYWIVKLNTLGIIQWQESLGGTGDDYGNSIRLINDGYIVAGMSNSNDGDVSGNHGDYDYWIVKLNSLGSIQWQESLGGAGSETWELILQTSDGGYCLAGTSNSNDGNVSGNHGGEDYWIVKLSSNPVSVEDLPVQISQIEVFPNPADQLVSVKVAAEKSNLTINLYNILGEHVSLQAITNGGRVDVSPLPNGLYLLTATTPSGKIFSHRIRKQN